MRTVPNRYRTHHPLSRTAELSPPLMLGLSAKIPQTDPVALSSSILQLAWRNLESRQGKPPIENEATHLRILPQEYGHVRQDVVISPELCASPPYKQKPKPTRQIARSRRLSLCECHSSVAPRREEPNNTQFLPLFLHENGVWEDLTHILVLLFVYSAGSHLHGPWRPVG
jgi:hypothetical protein